MGSVRRGMIVSVGGSLEPVISAINSYKNEVDRIIFLCSDTGDQNTSTKYWVDDKIPDLKNTKSYAGKNILSLTNYNGDYEVLGVAPDDLNSIYSELEKKYLEFFSSYYEVIAEFSAGTKMMSASLVLLASNYDNVRLTFHLSKRRNTIKIEGKSTLVHIDLEKILAGKLFRQVSGLWENYYYQSAIVVIDDFLKKHCINPEFRNILVKYREISMVFSLWDRFRFQDAVKALEPYKDIYPEHLKVLQNLANIHPANNGYRLDEIIRNARRRAHNEEYDNASARVYRAFELLGQILLWKFYDIDTSSLTFSKLKELRVEKIEYWRKKTDEKGNLKIGLIDDYKLLSSLPATKDFVTPVFDKEVNRMMEMLKSRNNSILAHGLNAVIKEEFENFIAYWEKFSADILRRCSEKIKVKGIDLPQRLPD